MAYSQYPWEGPDILEILKWRFENHFICCISQYNYDQWKSLNLQVWRLSWYMWRILLKTCCFCSSLDEFWVRFYDIIQQKQLVTSLSWSIHYLLSRMRDENNLECLLWYRILSDTSISGTLPSGIVDFQYLVTLWVSCIIECLHVIKNMRMTRQASRNCEFYTLQRTHTRTVEFHWTCGDPLQ